jgi:hypothetical protein
MTVSSVAAAIAPLQVPNMPDRLSLAQGSGSDPIVTWGPAAIDGMHGGATGFNLRSSPSGAGAWTLASGVTSPYDLSGLAAGAAIDVQVQSTNAAGTSPWSVAATLTTGSYAPNPPLVTGVTPPPDGTASRLTVAWSAPATDSTHGAATRYNLRFSSSGAANWTTVPGARSPYTLAGLAGAMAIDVEVQPTNAAATPGAWSATATGTTWGATVTPGSWGQVASSQTQGGSLVPNGGVNVIASAAPNAVTGAAFAWSTSLTTVPTAGLILAGADGQANGWGQWFNAPSAPGTWYLWLLARGGGGTIGALVTAAIAVT